MKKILWFFTLTLFCLLPLRGQIVQDYSEQLLVLDSLLLRCDTTAIYNIIHNDSSGNKGITTSTPSDWDSVKSAYLSILSEIARALDQSLEGKKSAITEAKEMDHRYHKQDVGEKAFAAYEKFKEVNLKGNVDSAITFFVVANYFRINYINELKKCLSLNADSIKTYLGKAEIEISIAQQDRAIGNGFSNLYRANQLMEIYNTQDRQSRAYRSLSSKLVKQYENLRRKLKELQEDRRIEQKSDYRELEFTLGGSFGGLYSISESYPLYIVNKTYIFRYANEAIFTYSVSANILYYMKNYLSFELLYGYAKGYFQPPKYPFNAVDLYSFFPKQNRSIVYSSISFITNYYLRIKTGLRPLVGLGLSYSSAYVSQVESQYPYFLSCISYAQHRNSLRVIARSGLEYIPNAASFLSYSVFIDFSVKLKSEQEVSLLMIEPYLRISWLIR